MKFSYNWLKDYIDIKETPEELAEVLTMHSFEAEGVEKIGQGLGKVVVGEVMETQKHPNADRLKITKINVGKEILQIVCGAPNVAPGQKVAVALVGAKLPSGMAIEAREVRGIKSSGMICAEDELGLGENHEGIMVLPAGLSLGTEVTEALGLSDAIIDFSILPDRSHDALSYWGLAQETAAVLNKKLRTGIYQETEFDLKESKKFNIRKILGVEIQDKDLCRRYSARVIKNVSVHPSPFWLQMRLKLSGIRPINNLVDISNYVMLETGQPLHIFDLDKISGEAEKKIIVRRAKKGEKILALDGKEYALDNDILVIADPKKPLAIAGVMGGEESAVTNQTKNIVIESANFEPVGIRRTSVKLGLKSDSSYRFEREPDRNLTTLALDRASEIANKLAGGDLAKGMIDIYPAKTKLRTIKLEFAKIGKLLGTNIPLKKASQILISLGFEVKKTKKDSVEVVVPTRRLDVIGQIELVREIARIYGYDNIKPIEPKTSLALPEINSSAIWQKEIKETLSSIGFTEVYNYSFLGDKEIEHIGGDKSHYWELANPINPEHKYLRKNLLPLILNNIASNSRILGDRGIRIFEIGKVFSKYGYCLLEKHNAPAEEKAKEIPEAHEKMMASGAIWRKDSPELFYEVKNSVEILLNKLSVKDFVFVPLESQIPHFPVWHLKRTASVEIAGEAIGIVGEIDLQILKNFGIEGRVGAFNINFEKLLKYGKSQKIIYHGISKFPPIRLDLAVIIPKKVLWSEIKELVISLGNGLVRDSEVFDIYEGKNIPADKRSLAFHITFQSKERTLKDEEVKNITNRIVEELKNKFGAVLRK